MENSKIEWCDHTFNPWIGCTKVSPGCANCYAEARDQRFAGGAHWGKGAKRQRTSEANWKQPIRWNKAARSYPDQCSVCGTRLCMEAQVQIGNATCCDQSNKEGEFDPSIPKCGGKVLRNIRPRVFCASLADWLDDEVPTHWLAGLLELISSTPNLDWLLLTKRPENWHRRMVLAQSITVDGYSFPDARKLTDEWFAGRAPANVWIGTTVEDQAMADQRIPQLLSIPANIRFLSCEPLLGPVDVQSSLDKIPWQIGAASAGLHWVICGGESGPNARPMHPNWARSLRDQCATAGVSFLFKQWGEWLPACQSDIATATNPNHISLRVGKAKSGRELDGRTHDGIPLNSN